LTQNKHLQTLFPANLSCLVARKPNQTQEKVRKIKKKKEEVIRLKKFNEQPNDLHVYSAEIAICRLQHMFNFTVHG